MSVAYINLALPKFVFNDPGTPLKVTQTLDYRMAAEQLPKVRNQSDCSFRVLCCYFNPQSWLHHSPSFVRFCLFVWQGTRPKTFPPSWTKWQAFVLDMGRDITPQHVIDWFATTHKLEAQSILMGNEMVWVAYPYNASIRQRSATNISLPFVSIYNAAHPGAPLSKHARYIVLDVAVVDQTVSVLIPQVKLRLR